MWPVLSLSLAWGGALKSIPSFLVSQRMVVLPLSALGFSDYSVMTVTALVGDLYAYGKRSHAYCRQFMVGTHRIQAHSSPRVGPDRLQYVSRHAAQMIIYHSHRQALHASLTSPTHVQTERTHQLEVGCASGRDARRSECNGTSHSHLSVEHVICGGTRPQERAAA